MPVVLSYRLQLIYDLCVTILVDPAVFQKIQYRVAQLQFGEVTEPEQFAIGISAFYAHFFEEESAVGYYRIHRCC